MKDVSLSNVAFAATTSSVTRHAIATRNATSHVA